MSLNTTHRPFRHVQRLKAVLAERERRIGGMVGQTFVLRSRVANPEESRRLYRDRDGETCTVLGLSSDRVPCPLIVVFEDGYRGICEPEWLAPVERAEVA